MRDYELMVVISPQVTDEGVPAVLERVNQTIGDHGGLVTNTLTNPPWGHRKLAYPIQDHRDAFYAVLHMQLPSPRLEALERDLKLIDQIIRYLIVRRDESIKAEAKAAVRQASAARHAAEAEGSDDGGPGAE
jgi:small subunit ribosomal protein S6